MEVKNRVNLDFRVAEGSLNSLPPTFGILQLHEFCGKNSESTFRCSPVGCVGWIGDFLSGGEGLCEFGV